MNSANLPVEVVHAADMTHEYFMTHYFEPRVPVLPEVNQKQAISSG